MDLLLIIVILGFVALVGFFGYKFLQKGSSPVVLPPVNNLPVTPRIPPEVPPSKLSQEETFDTELKNTNLRD